MAVRIQLRRDTASNWSTNNPILRPGEVGIETDTLKFKIGPAVVAPAIGTAWNSITSYANVTPTGLSNSLGSYILASSQGNAGGPAELDSNGDLVVPENSIILWNDADYTYSTTVTATQPTADRTITIPDRSGTVITSGDTGTVTNTMLAGSIANNKLANSSITINGFAIALGGEAAYSTDNIQEGTTNKYFSNELAQDAVAQALSNGTHTNITVTYNDNSNAISLAAAPGYTNEEAVDAVAAALAAGTHTNISVSYDDNGNAISLTGAVTYTDENAQDAVGNAVGNGLDYDDNTGAISVDPSEFALSAVGAPTSDVSMASYKITNLATPTASGDAATKAYVDNTTAGLNFHAAVHAATTANLDATYANGTGGVGATLTANANGALVIDGHTLNADERVLVKNQTTGLQNGIYVVTATGDASNPYVLTRATDADNSPTGELAYGDFTFVQQGSTNAGFGFIVNTTGTITIGTTAISYVQFNAGQVVVAGNGLTEATPGTLAINTAVTVDLNTAQTLTNKTITGTFTGNLTGDITGNAGTVTNGVYTNGSYSNPSWITSLAWTKISSTPTTISGYGITDGVSTGGSYADPAWITSLAASKVGLGNVENTALSTWAGSANITTLGTIGTGTWNATAIGATKGGTGLTSYTTGDVVYASATNTLSKLAIGTEGYLLTSVGGVPTWAAAPISLPSQSGATAGKYLYSNGTSASWADTPIITGTSTITANTATTIDTNALSGFTSIEYMVSLKQGSKIRTSKVIVQTDGTSVDMTEFAITETGGTMSGVVVSASASAGNALLQVTVTDASSTNVAVKFSEIRF